MSFDLKYLYELLPALYRIRDTELGIRMLTDEDKAKLFALTGSTNEFPDEHIYGPLKSLLSVIADQVAVLEENLEQLYDDQFIETCAEWAVSYIGDLVGTRGLIEIPGSSFSQRGEVANTIAYRRRKGTASILEQLARDVTGWNASVVEYFQLLATTQYLNHLRPENQAFTAVRNWKVPEYINTPFDKTTRTADVRRIEKKRGKYNIPNIGIYLWRIDSFSLTKSPAYRVDERRFTFNALGLDGPLYNLPVTEDEITHLSEQENVPMPIARMVMKNDLAAFYGNDKSVLVYVDGNPAVPETANMITSPPAALEDIVCVCNLSDVYSGGIITGWANMPTDKIAIDPVLGRIAFPSSLDPPDSVHVNYYYGFSAAMGGGEYSRQATFSTGTDPVKISADSGTIQGALDQLATTGGIIEIMDNDYYFETPLIKVAEGKTIELRAADGCRPVLVLEDEMLIEGGENSNVIINGLMITGPGIRVPLKDSNNNDNGLQGLRILHCTLFPPANPSIGDIPAVTVGPRLVIETPDTIAELEKTICGPIRLFDGASMKITNSIIDALDENEPAYAGLSGVDQGGDLHMENCTIIGKVHTRMMKLATNSIFFAGLAPSAEWPVPVISRRLQEGCARFSYFSPGSRVPHPYMCQPKDMATAAAVRPVFTSLTYGDPGYCQLSRHCAREITRGADDDAEMGAFHDLYQPQRESNLKTRLDEYLRFGLETGIFYAS
jgi:hypothetical protein